MKALAVEDERRLAENVANDLRQCVGYAVDIQADGEAGMFMAENNEYDLVVLDLMLPKLAGPDLLQRYRKSGNEFLLSLRQTPRPAKSRRFQIREKIHPRSVRARRWRSTTRGTN